MFHVIVTRYQLNRIVDSTSHPYETLRQAFEFACKVPNDYTVCIIDEELHIWMNEIEARILDWHNWQETMDIFINKE